MTKTWNPDQYDNKHSFVWKYGEAVLNLLEPVSGERILDLGSGTGHLTNKIAEAGAEVIGIDVDDRMLDQARANYPHLQFEFGDGTSFKFDKPFDAVFSNAAIHWMKDPEAVAGSVFKALKPGGRFVGEFGHEGNIKQVHDSLANAIRRIDPGVNLQPSFKYYPTVGQYASLLEKVGFLVTWAGYFDRPTLLQGGEAGLENWIKTFCDDYLRCTSSGNHDRVFRLVEDEVRASLFYENAWHVDYKRIRFIARKV